MARASCCATMLHSLVGFGTAWMGEIGEKYLDEFPMCRHTKVRRNQTFKECRHKDV